MSDYTAKQIDEMDAMDGGERLGRFRRARAELGISSFGVSSFDLVPNADQYPDHGHPNDGQEEVYVVLGGSGEIEIEGERHPLDAGTMARVGPGTKRKIWPGDEGISVVPFGGRPGHSYAPPPEGKPFGLPEGAPEVTDDELSEGDFTVKKIDEMEAIYLGGFKRARAELGVSAFGFQVIDMPPNSGDAYPEHDHTHDGQEELYVGISGSGEIEIDGEHETLEPGMMIRVGPTAKRMVRSGDEPIRFLIAGAVPGEPYEPSDITKLGEPDPLAQ